MKRILSVVLIFSILLSFSALAAPEGSLPTGLCGIDSALVGCWPMDEGSGTTVSDVGAAPVNDGTLNGSPTWATGHDGLYGLSLNGTSQYVTVLDEYSLDLTTGMTLAAWVKPAKLGTQNIIKKTTSTTNPGFELSLSSGQKVFVRINGSATYRIDSTTSYPIDGNTWMHVTATYDGTNIRLYVNSVLEGTKPGVTITANATNLGIGAEPATTPANYLMGTIDDVRVYNRALTLTEIQALYNNHRPSAVNDGHTTNVNTPLNVAAPGVLSNDTDADADTMTAIKTSDPAHGVLTLNSNGSFSYTPTAGYSGTDSFTYRTSDGKHNSNAATVSITVGQPNNPPEVTNPGTQNSSEGAVISLQIQASDLDSDPLTYAASGLPEGLNINTSTGEIAGTITYHAGEGSPYSATVTVNDDRGGSTPVNFTWTVAQTASGLCSGPVSGMAACWPMEENGGSIVIDATVNGNDGNLTGTPSWVTGKTGAYALSLNGSTNALVPDDPSLDIASQITLAAWVKPAQTTTQNLIKKAVNSATDGYELGLAAVGSAAGQKYFVRFNQTTSGDGYRVNSTVNYPADGSTWVHVAATYDGATISLYVNGVLNNSLTPLTPLTILTNDLSLGIGSDSTGANRYTGAMDDARVYNRALTLPEIEILAGIPPSTPTAPSSLTATVTPGSQIDLTWADNSNNETGFQLETAPGPACTTWASLGSSAANAPTFRHWNTSANTQYCYRVRAAGSGGNSDWSNTATATTPTSYSALSLGRDRAYVRMTTEDQSAVQLKQFSLETWFRREGAGVTNTTGTGGIPQAIPLIAKGAAEAEDTTADENFLLVIDDATDVIAADFEECDPLDSAECASTGADSGLNHPILGTTTIFNNTWYHAAVTFDGSMTWRLYLNGSLENTLVVGHLPRWDNTSPLGLGTSMTTGGTAQGFFDGTLDEVRIWNYARSEAEIQSAMNSQISDPTTGLAARWSLNEASGTTVSGSAGTAVNGSIYPIASPTGWNWTQDAPFNINIWPDQPTNVEPEDGGDVANPPTLRVTVNDPENASMEVCFFGRPAPAAPDFTVAVIPDSQNYSASLNNGTPAMFNAQMQYIVDQRVSDNMAFVTHVGDVVNTGSNATEWANADAAYDILEGANPELIPYGIAMGNHDMDVYNDPTQTTSYNANFGYSRFAGRSYYKGAYDADGTPPPPDNDNNVEFFGQGGLDFMAIHLENDDSPDAPVLNWADDLLANNPTRQGIVVFHTLFDTTSGCTSPLSSAGDAIYAALSDRPNLFLMLGGHLSGENYCSVSRAGMNPVSLMLVDYQGRTNGGNGWMRLLEFSPAQDKIFAKTYSPTLGSFETDANSQFEISYPMGGSEAYTPLGCQNVASGGTASMLYEGLELGKIYEWYVTINDGARTTTSSTFDFVTIDPTAAVLADFNATAMDLSVSINFKTADETDLIGFNLYRADKQDGARIQLNPALIRAKNPGKMMGNAYQYLDQTVEAGKVYYYWIELVFRDKTQETGPVFAELFFEHRSWLPAVLR